MKLIALKVAINGLELKEVDFVELAGHLNRSVAAVKAKAKTLKS